METILCNAGTCQNEAAVLVEVLAKYDRSKVIETYTLCEEHDNEWPYAKLSGRVRIGPVYQPTKGENNGRNHRRLRA